MNRKERLRIAEVWEDARSVPVAIILYALVGCLYSFFKETDPFFVVFPFGLMFIAWAELVYVDRKRREVLENEGSK